MALKRNQEEPDKKVFCCAQFATVLGISYYWQLWTIITVDSNIIMHALFYSLYLETQIVLQFVSVSTLRCLDISATTLFEDLRRDLPEFYTFTGCDSTSAFATKEKLKCLKILESDKRFLNVFSLLDEQQVVIETDGVTFEELTCRTMVKKTFVSINDARYNVFWKKKAMPDRYMLQPSQDVLKIHIALVNFQTMGWKNTLSQHSA